MSTRVEKSIPVDAPVRAVYDQWTQFEEFPRFMGGVSEVRQTSDTTLHWVAEIAGVRREWDAAVLEQVPDQKVAWAATTGATNAGAVYFAPGGPGRTIVRLVLEFEPEGLVERAGDAMGVVGRQAESDLERFKAYMEERGTATGGWRGTVAGDVGTPGVEDAALSRGDDGKAGTSTAAKVAGAAGAAAAVAGAAAVASMSSDSSSTERVPATTQEPTREPGATGLHPGDEGYGVVHVIANEPGTPVDATGEPYPMTDPVDDVVGTTSATDDRG